MLVGGAVGATVTAHYAAQLAGEPLSGAAADDLLVAERVAARYETAPSAPLRPLGHGRGGTPSAAVDTELAYEARELWQTLLVRSPTCAGAVCGAPCSRSRGAATEIVELLELTQERQPADGAWEDELDRGRVWPGFDLATREATAANIGPMGPP